MAPAAWTVTGQLPTTRIPEGGTRFVQGVEISFVTAAGHTGTVFVPDAIYTVDAVRAAIAQKAALLDAVGNLTG